LTIEREPRLNGWAIRLAAGLMVTLALQFTASLVTPAEATHLTCGQTLGPGGTFTLDSSLSGCSDTALVVVSAQLNLNGHTVSCASEADTGIRIQGTGSRVTNGTVTRCGFGVYIGGEGEHEVDNVKATDNNAGFLVATGSRNELRSNTATGNDFGFVVQVSNNRLSANTASGQITSFNVNGGTGNELTDNVARDSVYGFQVGAAGMALTRNTATGNRAGFLVVANGSEINNNVASGNLSGILVLSGAEGNRLRSNAAGGNTVDLVDENVPCGRNEWQGNTFGLANEACIR